MGKFIDLTGKKFSMLTVKGVNHKNEKGKYFWKCLCDCGKETIVLGNSLRSFNTKSCGCLKIDNPSHFIHGFTGNPTYKIWAGMIQRCTDSNRVGYENYGGRYIKICEKWLTFKGFYEEMGDRPQNTSLDRINNDGDYCKENCRWATRKEQNNNTRRNVNITYNGQTKTLSQWSEILKINYKVLFSRIRDYHWDIEKAFTEKVKSYKKG